MSIGSFTARWRIGITDEQFNRIWQVILDSRASAAIAAPDFASFIDTLARATGRNEAALRRRFKEAADLATVADVLRACGYGDDLHRLLVDINELHTRELQGERASAETRLAQVLFRDEA